MSYSTESGSPDASTRLEGDTHDTAARRELHIVPLSHAVATPGDSFDGP
jgi:hypothetical protein